MRPHDHQHAGIVDQVGRQGIVLLNGKGQISAMDPAAEHMFGCHSLDLVGTAFESLLAAPPNPALDWATGAGGQTPWQRSRSGCMAQRADGTQFAIHFVISRMAPHGDCFAVFVQDLSLEPALQAELQAVERQWRALIELAPIAIWVAENEQVVLANRAAGELMGCDSGAALIGQSVYALLSDADHAELQRHLAQAASHKGRIGHLKARLKHLKGEVPEVEIAVAALPDHGRTTVQMVVSNVSQRNLEIREIQRSRQLLKRLSANLVEAREEERRRIARELHDELSQGLSALKMDIAHCARSQQLPGNERRVAALLASLDGLLTSVRRIASDLRPLMLDDLGLNDAIEALASEFSRRTGTAIELHLDRLEPPPDEKLSIALYRMVQEALTNVARHSGATKVQIELRCAAGTLTLSVHDDGVGLTSPAQPQRDSQFGLLGMQERADALGGNLHIQNLRDGGACLVVQLPVDRRSPAHSDVS